MGWLTDDQSDAHIRVLLDDSVDGVDVVVVILKTVVGYGVLAVGGQSSAVTIRQVVDDESAHDWRGGASGVLRLDVGEVSVHGRDLGESVATHPVSIGSVRARLKTDLQPHKGADVGNGAGCWCKAGREGRNGDRIDLGRIVRVGVDLLARERVAGDAHWRTSSRRRRATDGGGRRLGGAWRSGGRSLG